MKPGSTCSVACYAGYEVSGSETIECTDESDAAEGLLLWSDEKPGFLLEHKTRNTLKKLYVKTLESGRPANQKAVIWKTYQ